MQISDKKVKIALANGCLTITQAAERAGLSRQRYNILLKKIKAIEKDLEEYDAIHHFITDNGSGSGEHVFRSENPFGQGEP